ncbi:MAG TPA: hypothetical protein VEL31_04570 [Ktedonobacteraceae bacterium]|nr:hypothetical protein [Ktedonobacteraceae bacterium]
MKKFYFVGGPKTGQAEAFFRRLNQIGGTPSGWRLYPHASSDNKALHLVDAESQDDIVRHLEHFQDIYECSEIVEIIERQ